jgi:putrescine transport system permease protein
LAVIGIPSFWLLLFFLVPFVIVLKIAFSETQIAMPPYQPMVQWVGERLSDIRLHINPGNFAYLVEDSLYVSAYLNSIWVAAVSTFITLLSAIHLLCHRPCRTQWRTLLLMMVVLPFWTSLLLRVYAWIASSRTTV